MADVAVVIGNYQGADVLPDCLASLGTQTLAPAEVIVVDAGSTDASEELARCMGCRVPAHRESRPRPPLQPRRDACVLRLRVPAEQRRRARHAVHRAARRTRSRQTRTRFAADPRQLAWDGLGARPRAHRDRTRPASPPLTCPGFTIDSGVPADEIMPTLCANGAAMLVAPRPAARARRVRRDVLPGPGGPRPLLASVAPRVAAASTCRTLRAPPRRRRHDRRDPAARGCARRTTTSSASR